MVSSCRKVLLVDDDALVRAVMTDVLDGLGFEVVGAENGAEALQQLEKHRDLAVLITDVLMPTMDGWTLAEKVRAVHPAIPVVYVTGYYAENARPVDGSRVVRKPFRSTEFAKALAEVL